MFKINVNQMFNQAVNTMRNITPEITLGKVTWLCEVKPKAVLEPTSTTNDIKAIMDTLTPPISN